MRLVHFSTYDDGGGAAKAAARLHAALLETGCDSSLIVGHKTSNLPGVYSAETIPLRIYQKANALVIHALNPPSTFVPELYDTPNPVCLFHAEKADIIHLHWVANFLTSQQVRWMYKKTSVPIVWTLMDVAPLTGGCHYTSGCDGYAYSCGHCPQIRFGFGRDISRWTWQQKQRNFRGIPMALVAPTSWVAQYIAKSSLFQDARVVRIPLGINPQAFCPALQKPVREKWGLPLDKKVILFGANSIAEERKGMRYLIQALTRLKQILAEAVADSILLLIIGNDTWAEQVQAPFPSRQLGYLKDEVTLASAYQAADLFVCPSIEDAGPMMIPEAMMCGTPVVAFDTGGAPDLIRTMENGYLAKYKDIPDLAQGMATLLSSPDLSAMRHAVQEMAIRIHAPTVVAAQYLELYNTLKES